MNKIFVKGAWGDLGLRISPALARKVSPEDLTRTMRSPGVWCEYRDQPVKARRGFAQGFHHILTFHVELVKGTPARTLRALLENDRNLG